MPRGRDTGAPSVAAEAQRIDKWLWFARVVKTRTAAADLVAEGKVRLNRTKIDKPGTTVRIGDVLTVVAHSRVRVLEVLSPGTRRGPPGEAATLFRDRSAPAGAAATARDTDPSSREPRTAPRDDGEA